MHERRRTHRCRRLDDGWCFDPVVGDNRRRRVDDAKICRDAGHALQLAARAQQVALARRSTLALVGVEEGRARGATQHHHQFPDQVVRRVNRGVHAGSTRWRSAVSGIADQKHAAVTEALGHFRPDTDELVVQHVDREIRRAGGTPDEID